MSLHPRAGLPAEQEQLVDLNKLVDAYYQKSPDPQQSAQLVSFGTSGHRGSSLKSTFNRTHIAAICQALAEYRLQQNINGPMYIGIDTHALSIPAFETAVEVLAANGVTLLVQQDKGYTPTPVVSHAILNYNRGRQSGFADGVVITPSHNPPEDGGFKYNPPHGGSADSDVTNHIQNRANALIQAQLGEVKQWSFDKAMASEWVTQIDFAEQYIAELDQVLNLDKVRDAGLKLGADPLGGSGLAYWDRIAEHYGLDISVTNKQVDQQFAFMRLDKDGKIRMDCSSAYAMAGLIEMKDHFDLAFGNDPDFDRHGIVTKSRGLMNPNHYLAVAINYLYQHRPQWSDALKIGKTLVSSGLIDRVAHHLGKSVAEMPVGFKWFVQGLSQGELGFAGEESAGGIFLRKDGSAWATDKDGFIMCLLGAEILATTGKDPGEHYQQLIDRFGEPFYSRIDVAASFKQKHVLKNLDAASIQSDSLAGESIQQVLTHAKANQAAIGGVKVSTENGWFAARPSGTENVYKIYAESFVDQTHLQNLINEAEGVVSQAFQQANV
jgi:phosphoglucomutase